MAIPDNVKIQRDQDALVHYAAARIVKIVRASLDFNDSFSLALAGGSTPRPIYEQLATTYKDALDWSKIHLWFGDERSVLPDDAQSNYHMVNEALLQHIDMPETNVHRMKGEDDPATAAAAYESELLAFFGDHDQWFDMTLLGMGEDGHTASLFPGTAAVHETAKFVIAHHVEAKGDLSRITLTFPALLKSCNIMFLVSGEGKADALHEVLNGDDAPDTYPSQVIARGDHEHIIWAVDEAAASKLR